MGLYPNRLCTWGGGVGGLFLLMVMALLASPAAAQTWTGGGLDTNGSTPANWGGGILPSLTGGTSTLTFASSGTIATLNTPLDIMRLVFSAAPAAAGPVGSVPAATAFAINGGSTLTLRAETIGGGVTGLTAAPWSAVPTAVYRITTPVSLAASQVWAIENGSGPTFVVVDGAIGGSGSLEKRGSGTLVLTGSSIFAGNTSIAGGTLQFGNGGVAGSVSGPIVNNSTLAYGNGIGNAATVANLITGTGGLDVQGYGPVLLSNLANSFSGSITTSGQLIVANPAALGSGTSPILVTGRQSATPGGGLLRIVSPAAPAMLARDIALLPTSFTPSLSANLRVSGGISTIGDVTIAGAITTSPTFDASVGTSYGTLTLGGGIIT